MTIDSMNALEYAAFTRLALQFFAAGCALIAATLLTLHFYEWRKSNRK